MKWRRWEPSRDGYRGSPARPGATATDDRGAYRPRRYRETPEVVARLVATEAMLEQERAARETRRAALIDAVQRDRLRRAVVGQA